MTVARFGCSLMAIMSAALWQFAQRGTIGGVYERLTRDRTARLKPFAAGIQPATVTASAVICATWRTCPARRCRRNRARRKKPGGSGRQIDSGAQPGRDSSSAAGWAVMPGPWPGGRSAAAAAAWAGQPSPSRARWKQLRCFLFHEQARGYGIAYTRAIKVLRAQYAKRAVAASP